MTTGRLYQIRFNNPYRTPPDGRPRILAEMFVLADDHAGGRCPAAIDAYPRPAGYSIYITHIRAPMQTKPPEVRARIRRQRLAARNARKAPLFAEAFTAEQIAAKPDYYLAGTSDHDAAREAILEDERATYNRMLATHGQLIIHTSDSSDPSANP